MSVPVREKRNSSKDLENFAKQIEKMFRKGKDQGPLAMKRQICRLLASVDPRVSAAMIAKWVEWRYGNKQIHEHTGREGGPIEHTIRFGDGKSSS